MTREFASIHDFINHYNTVNGGYFFDNDTLKCFGERLSDMRVLKGTRILPVDGQDIEVYTISVLQRNYPGGARRTYKHFDVNTMDDMFLL